MHSRVEIKTKQHLANAQHTDYRQNKWSQEGPNQPNIQ